MLTLFIAFNLGRGRQFPVLQPTFIHTDIRKNYKVTCSMATQKGWVRIGSREEPLR
ncbi:hypothetical protein GXM_08320 [Nostoc sphaeroides CCNUC1]|uniref:Uncharacterized protein n=1 Tax=Nostoc sphaeroides CCNUC1 TaxID=2653204 RepID=A0A5P8WF64_9NOSO|nr:hypothetical protein GXM_08320 [Nostoc sphaeroides CCNUC1]